MPRTGGVYSPPAGTKGVPNTTIQSVPYNTLIDDLTADANTARPVTAGGTGATSASAARAALGVEIGTNVQAYDAGLQSIAGLTTTANKMLYTTDTDVYATTALTPLGRTLLGGVDAASMRGTLGLAAVAASGSANDIASGTLNDARLPTTMSAKIFNGTISGTRIELNGSYVTTGADFIFRNAGNKHIWFRTPADVNRALLYNEVADNSLRLVLYNASGAFVRALSFRESDGMLTVEGPIAVGLNTITGGDITASRGNGTGVIFLGGGSRYLHYDGSKYVMPAANLLLGDATYQTDGNVIFAGGMAAYGGSLAAALSNKVSSGGEAGSARYLKQGGASGGVNMQFNWSGQGGQPNWLWGGNDGTNMYVYNPSNFNVNWANNSGNADTVDGLHAAAFAQIYTGSNAGELNFPLGHTIALGHNGGLVARNATIIPNIYAGDSAQYVGYASGGILSGTWRVRGLTATFGGASNGWLVQRVA
ncbi:MAG TPA: hypothetical protein VGO04_23570 [Ensifer sp.]|jgi:hypothetical protein|uniref:hypothetical protein n=1 Tax=Ensifer sp. TaxID=1872086 RepID=UPI002E15FE83|nr:hypothetical protein [Ensifer sp.]